MAGTECVTSLSLKHAARLVDGSDELTVLCAQLPVSRWLSRGPVVADL